MNPSRKLAAIMFTDIVGYTSMMQADEAKTLAVIKHYTSTLDSCVKQFNGQVLNFYGDGSLCIFNSATDAAHCALAVQASLKSNPPVPLRIGLHIGEVFFEGDKALGDGVNVASRIQSLGQENTVLVSAEFNDKIKNNAAFSSASLGRFDFKHVEKPLEVFALTNEGLFVPKRNTLQGKLKTSNSKLKLGLAAIAITLALISLGVIWNLQDANPEEKIIAVLPFANMSPDVENEFFAAGVHEDVMINLSSIRGLKVISRTSVLQYKGQKGDLKAIGKSLGAGYVVEGSVRREGDQVLVIAQLIDARNDVSLWSARYDRKLNNVFELQSEIALEIASTLNAAITNANRKLLQAAPTVIIEAYDNYSKARNVLTRSWPSYKRIMEAIPLLQKAVEIDPEFTQGWALLSRAQTSRVERVREFDNRQDEVKEAEELATHALEEAQHLGANHVETLKAEGYYHYIVKGDKVKGLKSFDRALELFPNDSEILFYQAIIYVYLGQLDPAIANLEKSYAIDNANGQLKYFLSYAYEVTHRYNKLVPLLEQFLEKDPEATHYEVQAKYFQFLLDGSLASFQKFEESVKTVERTPKCDERSVQNNEMVVAMINNEFEAYTKSWMGKWDQHNRGHGNWSCPAQLNEEANHAHLLMQNGDPAKADEIILYAKNSSTRPVDERSVCIFDKAVFTPKLNFMSGEKLVAKNEFYEVMPRVLKNKSFPRGVVERAVLLETADMVAPDYVYKLFKELTAEPPSLISLETVCANPWTFPNLIKDPEFIKEVRKDGRFVKFLEHYGLLARA